MRKYFTQLSNTKFKSNGFLVDLLLEIQPGAKKFTLYFKVGDNKYICDGVLSRSMELLGQRVTIKRNLWRWKFYLIEESILLKRKKSTGRVRPINAPRPCPPQKPKSKGAPLPPLVLKHDYGEGRVSKKSIREAISKLKRRSSGRVRPTNIPPPPPNKTVFLIQEFSFGEWWDYSGFCGEININEGDGFLDKNSALTHLSSIIKMKNSKFRIVKRSIIDETILEKTY